jgi:hypothetical protein
MIEAVEREITLRCAQISRCKADKVQVCGIQLQTVPDVGVQPLRSQAGCALEHVVSVYKAVASNLRFPVTVRLCM